MTSTRTGVAVSGGADSVALLHMLLPGPDALTVLHVNHHLRGAESDADEAFVREMARVLGLPVLVHHAPPQSGNLEQAARDARYAWFRELLREGSVGRIALGHTLSDQAETVLFRVVRGSGTAGLAAMRAETRDGFVRPLLRMTRSEVREWLSVRGIGWHEDSSNASGRFARNRIRHEILPLLAGENPAVERALARLAEQAADEEDYWSAELPRLASFVKLGTGCAEWNARELAALPKAAGRRVIRHVLEHVRGDLRQIEFSHVEAIRELAFAAAGEGTVQVPGVRVRRSFCAMRIERPAGEPSHFRLPLKIPGDTRVPGYGWNLTSELKSAESVYNGGGYQLDWGLVSGSLELRNWRPGDRYERAGESRGGKLKHLFHKARIPIWERRQWPVITREGKIVWARRFGAAPEFARSSATRMVLVIRETPLCLQNPSERTNQNV